MILFKLSMLFNSENFVSECFLSILSKMFLISLLFLSFFILFLNLNFLAINKNYPAMAFSIYL